MLTAYSIFSAETLGDLRRLIFSLCKQCKWRLILFHSNKMRLMAFAAGRKDEAFRLLLEVEASDRFGMFKHESARLKKIMAHSPS